MKIFNIIFLGLILLSGCGPNNPNTNKKTTTVSNTPVSGNSVAGSSTSTTTVSVIQAKPIVSLTGFSKGDNFTVDGPLWYDGTAKLDELSSTQVSFNILMSVPPLVGSYQVKDGRINISIRLEKDNKGIYNLMILDLFKNKAYLVPGVKLESGKTDGDWFNSPKEYIKIFNTNFEYKFVISQPKTITITSSTMPGSLDLSKK